MADSASAVAFGEVQAGRFGQGIAALDGPDAVVVAGGPADPGGAYEAVFGEAVELLAPGLERGSVWASETGWDHSTESLALQREASGGYVLAVGAFLAHGTTGRPGAVYLVRDSAPAASLQDAAHATITGDGAGFGTAGQIKLGATVAWLDLGGPGGTELVVNAPGSSPLPGSTTPDGAAIYAFDQEITGTLNVFDAERRIQAPTAYFGGHFAGWDADGDGLDDLAASQLFGDGRDDRILAFASPWVADLTPDDAAAEWTVEAFNVVDNVIAVGDATGDGAPDLFIGGVTWSGAGVERAGGAWVLAGGDAGGGSVLDAPVHLYGDEPGEGVGSAAAGGDFDGDGAWDLAVGCQGLSPGALPGKVLVFRGPLPDGVLDEAAADAVMHGEFAFDSFGMTLQEVDVEGDGRSELLVGAPGADSDVGRVYLLDGVGLFP